MALPVLSESVDEVYEMRSADVPNFEAMQKAKQPPLVALLNPIIGALGVFAGSRLKEMSLHRVFKIKKASNGRLK